MLFEFREAVPFFEEVSRWPESTDRVVELALEEAENNGLAAMDALHVAAAIILDADELITIEKRAKPIHRVTSVSVQTIQPE